MQAKWPQMQLEIGEQGAGGCHHALLVVWLVVGP